MPLAFNKDKTEGFAFGDKKPKIQTFESVLAACRKKFERSKMLLQRAGRKSNVRKCSCSVQEQNRKAEELHETSVKSVKSVVFYYKIIMSSYLILNFELYVVPLHPN